MFVNFVAIKCPEIQGCSVRLIPTATSLFSISKLKIQRNNIPALNQGSIKSLS